MTENKQATNEEILRKLDLPRNLAATAYCDACQKLLTDGTQPNIACGDCTRECSKCLSQLPCAQFRCYIKDGVKLTHTGFKGQCTPCVAIEATARDVRPPPPPPSLVDFQPIVPHHLWLCI